jgi:hypothetical protein
MHAAPTMSRLAEIMAVFAGRAPVNASDATVAVVGLGPPVPPSCRVTSGDTAGGAVVVGAPGPVVEVVVDVVVVGGSVVVVVDVVVVGGSVVVVVDVVVDVVDVVVLVVVDVVVLEVVVVVDPGATTVNETEGVGDVDGTPIGETVAVWLPSP